MARFPRSAVLALLHVSTGLGQVLEVPELPWCDFMQAWCKSLQSFRRMVPYEMDWETKYLAKRRDWMVFPGRREASLEGTGTSLYDLFASVGAMPLRPGLSGHCWFHGQGFYKQDRFLFRQLGGVVGKCTLLPIDGPNLTSSGVLCECTAPEDPSAFGGHFVELGASDGQAMSTTLFLEAQMGWTGLLIEPDPVKFARLRVSRPRSATVNAAVGAEEGEVFFYSFIGPGFDLLSCMHGVGNCPTAAEAYRFASGFSRQRGKKLSMRRDRVAVRLFSDLLRTHLPAVTPGSRPRLWISLDVEGAEDLVLSTLNASGRVADFISVESTQPNPEVLALLRRNDYVLHAAGDATILDHWFVPARQYEESKTRWWCDQLAQVGVALKDNPGNKHLLQVRRWWSKGLRRRNLRSMPASCRSQALQD